MTKNDLISEVTSGFVMFLNKNQQEFVKSTFIVKIQG